MFFSPYTIIFFFIFLFGLLFLFAFIHIGLITIAFEKIGLSPSQVFGFLLLSLFGSHVNIPIKRIKNEIEELPAVVRFYGITYRIPQINFHHTVIAVNFGGALVPLFLSVYLMIKWNLFMEPLIGVALVAAITYFMARPIPGLGIGLPLFIPPILAALAAVLVSTGDHAPVVAYISGTMGTLIGADILHLKNVTKLNAPMASIGGAGTFDGIFLTGIIAVLLA